VFAIEIILLHGDESGINSEIKSQMRMAIFYYIKCLQVKRENRARNEILRGEVDETSGTRNQEIEHGDGKAMPKE
jgi:hypothetical protein